MQTVDRIRLNCGYSEDTRKRHIDIDACAPIVTNHRQLALDTSPFQNTFVDEVLNHNTLKYQHAQKTCRQRRSRPSTNGLQTKTVSIDIRLVTKKTGFMNRCLRVATPKTERFDNDALAKGPSVSAVVPRIP